MADDRYSVHGELLARSSLEDFGDSHSFGGTVGFTMKVPDRSCRRFGPAQCASGGGAFGTTLRRNGTSAVAMTNATMITRKASA